MGSRTESLLELSILMMSMGGIGGGIALLMFIASLFCNKEKATKITNIAGKLFLGSGLILLIGAGICFGAFN